MEVSNVVERVKKLLALATSSNANEAAAAAAAANRLMDQYRISEVDLEVSGGESEAIEEDTNYIYQSGRVIKWKCSLIRALSKHYGCSYWNDCTWETGRRVSRYRVVGRRSDITIVNYMYSWLSLECQRLSGNFAGSGRVFLASYCQGFVQGITEQLKLSRQEVQKEASSSAIVLLNQREEQAKAFLYSIHNNLVTQKSSSHSRINQSAYGAGKEQGRKIHLGSALAVGSKIKMLT